MSVLGTRSTSFSFGQPPAKQPFNFGGPSAAAGAGPSTTPTGQGNAQANPIPTFTFGGPSQTTTPAAPTSLFGGNASNAAAKPSGFSFGQPATSQQPQQQQTGGLFAGFGQQQQQQQQPAAGQGQAGQAGMGGSLFGASTTQNAQAGSSLFGNTNNQQQQPFSFGQPQQQQQQQQRQQNQFQPQQQQSLGQGLSGGFQLGQSQAIPQINPASPFAQRAFYQKERFNELPEDCRKLLEELDSHISSQTRLQDELASKDIGSEIQKRRTEWKDVHNTLGNSSVLLEQDTELIRAIVDRVDKDRGDFVSLFEIAQNFKEGKTDGKQWTNWPGDFFAKAAADFKERITRYRSTMEEISKQLLTIDNRNNHSPELISDVIINQHATFMALASNVASLHSEIDQLRKDYTQWYQQQYRSVQDPFAMSMLTSTL